MFNGYRVSILDDEKVLEINDKFYVILLSHTKKKNLIQVTEARRTASYPSPQLYSQQYTLHQLIVICSWEAITTYVSFVYHNSVLGLFLNKTWNHILIWA